MKGLNYLTFIIALQIVSFSFAQTAKTKHALIIAISNYPAGSGWDRQNPLSSSKDAELIKNVLFKQDFIANNIKVVSDKEATKEDILKAMKDFTDKVNKGDVVLIHVSSHGEQIQDDNNDEVDGKDECIVPYGAMAPNVEGVTYENSNSKYLRDDDFGKAIYDLRTKLGKEGDVLVTMDCCHSGSGTRGLAKVRGGFPHLVSTGFKEPDKKETSLIQDEVKSRGDNDELATYITIAAARANELDAECKDDNNVNVGSLSYAFSKTFSNMTDKRMTYRELFSRILSTMNEKVPNQHPVLEGDGQDRKIFGGDFVSQEDYFYIKSITNNEIVINGGKLNGIYDSTKIELHTDPISDTMNLIAKGVVTRADNFTSTIRLNKSISIKPGEAWCFVTEQSFGDMTVHIGFDGININDQKIIKDYFKDFELVKFDGISDILLKTDVINSDKIIITYTNGTRFKEGKSFSVKTNSDLNSLKISLQDFARYSAIRNMNFFNNDYNLKIELLPLNAQEKVDTSLMPVITRNGIMEFQNGDKFVLQVTNIGSMPAYFNILDMQPDGEINPILPNSKQPIITAEDLKISPGVTKRFESYKIKVSPPFGTEVFKIFASSEPINLAIITATRGINSRGNLNSIEKYVQKSYGMTTSRGAEGVNDASGSSFEITFNIIDKRLANK